MASYIFYGATEPTKLTVIVSAKVGSLKGYRDHHSASFTAKNVPRDSQKSKQENQILAKKKSEFSPSAHKLNMYIATKTDKEKKSK